MKAADVVICRAGATTLPSWLRRARPAILVPLPTATDDHQRKNAEVVAQAGAAVVIRGTGADAATRWPRRLPGWSATRSGVARMAIAARALARPDAAARIADRVEELASTGLGQGGRRAR